MKFGHSEFEQRHRYSGPLYEQISKLLHERIQSHVWAVGNPLPNENDLARDYGVSIGTMRRALEKLEAAGLITRRQGRGTFVTDPTKAARRRQEKFFLNGRQYIVEDFTYDCCDVAEATAEVVSALALATGASIVLVRRHKVLKGLISISEEMHIPEAVAGNLVADPEARRNIGCDMLDSCMASVRKCREQLRPGVADEHVSSVLGVPVGTPVLRCQRLSVDQAGKPVEWTKRVIILDRVEYVVEVS